MSNFTASYRRNVWCKDRSVVLGADTTLVGTLYAAYSSRVAFSSRVSMIFGRNGPSATRLHNCTSRISKSEQK